MNATVEQISDKIKFFPPELLNRILGYVEALAEDKKYVEIPEWQKEEVRESVSEYKKNPSAAHDFENILNDIENEL